MSKTLQEIVGAVEIIAGAILIATGNVTLGVSLIITGVSTEATALLTPGIPKRKAAEATLDLGEVPRSAIFGQALVGGSLIDAFDYDGKYLTDWEVVDIALADHGCEALVGFYVNDTYVPFTGNGAVTGYNTQLAVTFYPGTLDQAADSLFTGHGGSAATDNLAGICHVVVSYKADKKTAKHPIWPGGRPRFRWLVKGKRCYIARKDGSLPGGSGSHRWTDPSTWEWTDNPIDCRYNWVRGVFAGDQVDKPEMLLVGRGLTAIEAPPANTFAPANLCDELVPLKAGGTEKRYRIGGEIKADEDFGSVEEQFAAACAGIITQPEGSVEIEPGHAKAPVAYITDDDIVVGTSVQRADFRSDADDEWANTIVATYIEPSQQWTDHAAPVRRVVADLIPDGGPREQSLSLEMVQSGTQAQRCAEIKRRMGRLWRTRGITLGPRFAGLEEGDWIVWTSKRYSSGQPVTFRVDSYSLPKEWQNTLSLREINADVFAWNAATDEASDTSVATQQAAPPDIGAPLATAWALTQSASPTPMLIVTGAVDDPSAETILFEVKPHSAATWNAAGSEPASITRKEIVAVSGQSYDVALSYVVDGTPGDRLVLGPLTVDAATVAPVTAASATGGTGQAVLGWRNPASPNFGATKLFRATGASALRSAAVQIGTDDKGAILETRSVTHTGLAAGTYRYWWDTVSDAGAAGSEVGPINVTVT